MDKNVFIIALAKALSSNGRVSEVEARKLYDEISRDYDHELHVKLEEWFVKQNNEQGQTMSIGTIMATMAFCMAQFIYDGCDTDDEICIMSQPYADYIHQAAHGLFREHGVSVNRKKVG